MKEFERLFVYPESYLEFEQRFHPDELYDRFRDKFLVKIKMMQKKPYVITPPNGLLIYGPPCNGKTLMAVQFAQQTNLPYAIISLHDVLDEHSSHTHARFFSVFDYALTKAPCVLILDNVETIIPSRDKMKNNPEFIDVMANLSTIRDCGKKGVFVFATTSKPSDLDPVLGMSGYLNELFYAAYPDDKQRLDIIKMLLGNKTSIEDLNIEELVKESDKFVIGDLIALIDEVAVKAAVANQPLSNDIIDEVLKDFRKPLASYEKKKYDEIHAILETKNKSTAKKTIGFQIR